jgi:hypothetical protein
VPWSRCLATSARGTSASTWPAAWGLAPRYLIGQLPDGVPAHAGTTDVDLIIGLALGDQTPQTYRTLQNNLEKAHFEQREPSFRWVRDVDGVTILIEFLCETDEVEPGRIFRPRGEYTGSMLGAFNVRAANLVRDDFIECDIEGERLDGGGNSRVTVRVANVLPYTILKIFAFQDRHESKDAYDLVFTLLNYAGGPRAAGRAAAASAVAQHPQATEAIGLLAERFRDASQDGPRATGPFSPPQTMMTRRQGYDRKRLRPSENSCRVSATPAYLALPTSQPVLQQGNWKCYSSRSGR